MRHVFAARPMFVLGGLAALRLAGCTDQPTEPRAGGPPLLPPGDLAARAIAVHVDLVRGTVTTLDRTQGSAASGVQLALLGANEISATTSNLTRSAVGAFIAKKVRVRFDVAITNRTSVALLTPTFPTPPSGVQAVLLFPFSTTLTGGNGAIDASTDWDGNGTPGSGASINFFNDASCSSGSKSDCYRWEGFPVPFAAGATTAVHQVGFDVDPTVLSFTTYFVLAADLQIPGSISGTVKSPGYGEIAGLTVNLSPVGRVATPAAGTGAYAFTGLAPGSYTVSVSGLPTECLAPPKTVTVASGSNTTVNFSAICQLIAFSSERNSIFGEIWVMHRDGTNPRQLTFASGFSFSVEAAWSPDGRFVAYEQNDLSANQGEDNYFTDIFKVDVDDGTVYQLTDDEAYNDRSPTFSPDGSKIAFVSDRDGQNDIYMMNSDGTGVTRITNSSLTEFGLAWSRDGSKIAFGGIDGSGSNIWVMNPDGTGLTKLTSSGSDSHPAWSPDGSKMTFESDRVEVRDVFVMDADGQNQTRLRLGQQPTWSPDGTKIAFSWTSGDAGSLEIYQMDPDGTNVERLTNVPDFDNFPAYQR